MIMTGHECKCLWWGWWGRGKEKILRAKGIGVQICTYEDSIMTPTKQCLKKQGRGKRVWEYNDRVNLFKVRCMESSQ
jgi:hypothetical protein